MAPALNENPLTATLLKLGDRPCFSQAKASDPLVSPANSPALLAKFPPTLLITGTRDFTMRPVIQSRRLLSAAGVDAELHV
jgi:monoterpene epsilon-lactone hydrolase